MNNNEQLLPDAVWLKPYAVADLPKEGWDIVAASAQSEKHTACYLLATPERLSALSRIQELEEALEKIADCSSGCEGCRDIALSALSADKEAGKDG